jgi:hypothetical protein
LRAARREGLAVRDRLEALTEADLGDGLKQVGLARPDGEFLAAQNLGLHLQCTDDGHG